mgnify:CR=1 FL=1|tara:strand:+ start:638 stop:1957 length:1320 start_codon:yes stop_codon:yes gene_type:complete
MEIYPVQLEPTHSGWYATLDKIRELDKLSSHIICDYLIIGGGWTGLHAARRLGQLSPLANIVLVDAGHIGNGSAGRCSGFAIDMAHNPKNKNFIESKKANEDELHVNSEGIAYMKNAVDELDIDCDWDPSGKYHAAATERGKACLDEMSIALNEIGKEYRWISAEEIQKITGSKHYSSAIHTPGTILLQPAKYLTQLKEKLPKNVTVYENTQVNSIDYGSQTHICVTENAEIRARQILLCNAAYLTKSGFFPNTAIPLYTYGSITRPLTKDELASIGSPKPFGIIPAESFGTTLRLTTDKRLLLRNVYSYARGFKSNATDIDYAKKKHQIAFDRRYPDLAKIGYEHSWGGLLTLAQNGGMVFGKLGERVYGAAFCNGTGVARGTAFGKALAELALGHSSRSVEILNNRKKPNYGLPNWITEIGVRMTTKYRFIKSGLET